MKLVASIYVPGVPVAQPRAKATHIGDVTRMYTPTSRKLADGRRVSNGIAEFKAALRIETSRVIQQLISGPVALSIVAVFPRQKNCVWKSKAMPRYRHTNKPDFDNVSKSIADALTGTAWVDDTQVCRCVVDKWRAAGDESPHVWVRVYVLGEGE